MVEEVGHKQGVPQSLLQHAKCRRQRNSDAQWDAWGPRGCGCRWWVFWLLAPPRPCCKKWMRINRIRSLQLSITKYRDSCLVGSGCCLQGDQLSFNLKCSTCWPFSRPPRCNEDLRSWCGGQRIKRPRNQQRVMACRQVCEIWGTERWCIGQEFFRVVGRWRKWISMTTRYGADFLWFQDVKTWRRTEPAGWLWPWGLDAELRNFWNGVGLAVADPSGYRKSQ